MIKYYSTKAILFLCFIVIYIPILPILFLYLILKMIADFLEIAMNRYDTLMAFKWLSKLTDNHNREKIKLYRNPNKPITTNKKLLIACFLVWCFIGSFSFLITLSNQG